MPVLTWRIQAGGVAKKVAEHWDEDRELRYEQWRAYEHMARELEHLGYLTIGPKQIDGEYTKRIMTLTIPDKP